MKKIAILIESLFDEQELIYPYHRLREDYEVHLIGSEKDKEYVSKSGFPLKSSHSSKDVDPKDYDGVFIPGGFSPDFMRRHDATKNFVKVLHEEGKPVAAICHGGWMLASSLDLKDVKLTSFFAIKDDLVHAGANWVDEEVVVDGNIITGRTPKDLPAVTKAFIEKI